MTRTSARPRVLGVGSQWRQAGDTIIGWIGSPSTTRFLDVLSPVLGPLRRDLPVRFVTMGAAAQHLPPGLQPDLQFAWSERTEAQFLRSIDIGVMPLHGGEFERYKCGYKLIQYMSGGKPWVATAFGYNTDLAAESGGGIAASDAAGWISALGRLCRDPALREQLAARGRRWFLEHAEVGAVGRKLRTLLRETSHG